MKKFGIRTSGRSMFLCLVAFAFLAVAGAEARADEVTITGSTTGIVSGVPQLTFAGNNNFTGTTALGVGSLSGSNSLGSFFLNTAPTQALNGSFTLNVTFTVPSGIAGGQGATYTATITGSVSPNLDQGGVTVDFDNTPQVFTFNDGTNTGSFSLTVADLFVQTGRSAQITAGFTGQQNPIPEPATMILFGTGVAGLAARVRQRKKARQK
ncbi:MAG TPA: PEP-CTERM sorting domain-containing protein [Pyrinomonadaceae bacterium]|nr:PEP-CTERM sorting domain-containing protein [Pyrinomonadaceae bacterium]